MKYKVKVYELEYLLDGKRQKSVVIAKNAEEAVKKVEQELKSKITLVLCAETGAQG